MFNILNLKQIGEESPFGSEKNINYNFQEIPKE